MGSDAAQKLFACKKYLYMILMPRPRQKKRRVGEKRFVPPPEGVEVYTTSTKHDKEDRERKQREQEAARESD